MLQVGFYYTDKTNNVYL